jgi:hypothetical protein
LQQWAEKAKIPRTTLVKRLKYNWSMERATGIKSEPTYNPQPKISYAFGFIN